MALSGTVGCQTDHCDRLCSETTTALADCMDQWPVSWTELDASGQRQFLNVCRTRWSQLQSSLEARELDDALEQCAETSDALEDMAADGTACDQLRAIYFGE